MPGDSKTEKATPKKRRDERKKGNVFLSKDAVAVATLLGSFLVLRLLFGTIVSTLSSFFHHCLSCAALPFGQGLSALRGTGIRLAADLARTAGPLIAVTVLLAVAATFAQTRLLVSGEAIKPKLNRISPLQGFKRLFSLRSVVETLKGILKITVLLYLIYNSLRQFVLLSPDYLHAELTGACAHLFGAIFTMVMQIAVAFTALAAFDFFYQWWDYERQLKMSKQEVKEEYKQTEGDPQVKGKIKEIQRKMAQARMMQQVPGADVVIRNPTHYAVALRYRPERDSAPVVLAKGQDHLALRIVREAEAHRITVIENVPLARSLYAAAEVGREIPPDLYAAVAEVLVYLYRVGHENRQP